MDIVVAENAHVYCSIILCSLVFLCLRMWNGIFFFYDHSWSAPSVELSSIVLEESVHVVHEFSLDLCYALFS